jgi:hypothetical protein
MKVRLYVNGLYWKTEEVNGGEYFAYYVVVDGQERSYLLGLPGYSSEKETCYEARFSIHAGGIHRRGDRMYGFCDDPAIYIDPITEEIRCRNKEALLIAAKQLG